jgi:hypothetical protein
MLAAPRTIALNGCRCPAYALPQRPHHMFSAAATRRLYGLRVQASRGPVVDMLKTGLPSSLPEVRPHKSAGEGQRDDFENCCHRRARRATLPLDSQSGCEQFGSDDGGGQRWNRDLARRWIFGVGYGIRGSLRTASYWVGSRWYRTKFAKYSRSN